MSLSRALAVLSLSLAGLFVAWSCSGTATTDPADAGTLPGSDGGGPAADASDSGWDGGGEADASDSGRDGGDSMDASDSGWDACWDSGPECMGSCCGTPQENGGNGSGDGGMEDGGDAGPACIEGERWCASTFLGDSIAVCSGEARVIAGVCGADELCSAGACLRLDGGFDCASTCHHGDLACDGQACSGGTCVGGVCTSPQACALGTTSCVNAPPELHVGIQACGDTTGALALHVVYGCDLSPGTSDSSPNQDWGFTAPATRSYAITVTPSTAWDPIVFVRDATCRLDRCLAGANTHGAGGTEVVTLSGAEATRYVVIVKGSAGDQAGGYTILVE